MFLYKINCPGNLLLYFNSLPDKEIREILLIKDDCPPSFVFNHFTKIGSVVLKCNFIFARKLGLSVRKTCCGNLLTTFLRLAFVRDFEAPNCQHSTKADMKN